MIVDIGAWTNLMGANLARQLAQRAIDCGYKPRQTRIERPLSIQGVGSGSQQCRWEMNCPIAVPHGDRALLHSITAPIVEGTGENLPGLLGLRSLERERAIVDTHRM